MVNKVIYSVTMTTKRSWVFEATTECNRAANAGYVNGRNPTQTTFSCFS